MTNFRLAALASAYVFAVAMDAAADPAPGCLASASTAWAAAGEGFMIEAASMGPDCQRAVVTLAVRAPDGTPIYAEAMRAADLLSFDGVTEVARMEAALADWIDQTHASLPRTSALPAWEDGKDSPFLGEFPFYPEAHIDRAGYEAYRKADQPLLCFVQGQESMACAALDPSVPQMERIGVQLFPG
ncbi:MAG: hypothetical protein HXY22_11805 [Alphaproteobacteria bacterium]|nr:hypothetical protein [Alphaproteobacteria bacterium]